MDKKIFLLDKNVYDDKFVNSLTEQKLEEIVASDDYEVNDAILKIDATGYGSAEQAIKEEMPFIDLNEYHVIMFDF